MQHWNSYQAGRNTARFGFKQNGIVYPMMLLVYFLGAVGYGNRDAVFAGGKQRHIKNEVGLKRVSLLAMNGLLSVR